MAYTTGIMLTSMGYLTSVSFDLCSQKLVNLREPIAAHESYFNFREPTVETDGSESISVSQPWHPQKLVTLPRGIGSPVQTKSHAATPSISRAVLSRTPPHQPVSHPHRSPPGHLLASPTTQPPARTTWPATT
jgi:hypothetical protein